MSGEFDVFGVYLTSQLVTSMLALVATFGLNRVLARVGFYRHVWHPALFECALFVVLWGLLLSLTHL